eukprot:gene1012-21305_t
MPDKDELQHGVVKKWFGDKGYGFISGDRVGRVHVGRDDLCEGTKNLHPGDEVSFFVSEAEERNLLPSAEEVKIEKLASQKKPEVDYRIDCMGEEMKGEITNYDEEKRFGFISTADYENAGDYFFHISKVTDPRLKEGINNGEQVSFKVAKGRKKDSIQAEQVRLIEQASGARQRVFRSRRERSRSKSPQRARKSQSRSPSPEREEPAPPAEPPVSAALVPLQDPAKIGSVTSLLKGLSPEQITAVMAGAGHAAGCALAAMTQMSPPDGK